MKGESSMFEHFKLEYLSAAWEISPFCFLILIFSFIFVAVPIVFIPAALIMKGAKPIHYLSYHKNHFQQTFQFHCESCKQIVTSNDSKCPHCGATYTDNPEYVSAKKTMQQNYLEYLKKQEEIIEQEMVRIKKRQKLSRLLSDRFAAPSFFNFELGTPPTYTPARDYEFSCEYCNNKLRGLSSDECGCPNCGASYQNNLELLIREEEDKVEKCHYEQYLELNKIKTEQNEKNNKDDVAHYKKYGKLYKMNDLTSNPVLGMFKMFFAFFVFYAIAYIIALLYIMYRGA